MFREDVEAERKSDGAANRREEHEELHGEADARRRGRRRGRRGRGTRAEVGEERKGEDVNGTSQNAQDLREKQSSKTKQRDDKMSQPDESEAGSGPHSAVAAAALISLCH